MAVHRGGRGPGHLSRYPRAAGGTPTPTPSEMAITFGRLTPAGAGGWKYFFATVAATELTGTNADHFAMSSGGVLTPTAAFVASPQASYTLGATINGQAVTLNITTEANGYTVSSLAEANALDWANIGSAARSVAFRGPLTGGPYQYDIVQPGQQNCSVNWWSSRSWTDIVTCKAADNTDKPLFVVASGGAGTRYSIHMTQINKLRWSNLKVYGPWYLADEGLNYGNSGGASTAVGALKQPMIWLRNTVGDFEVDNCELYGNLSSFPMADGEYVWYGVLGYTSGSTVTGHLNFHNNVAHDCRRLLTIPEGTSGGQITITNNEFYNFGADVMTFTKAWNVEVSWNYMHSAYTNPADVGHGDFVQSIYNGTDVLSNVNIFGNVMTPYRQDGQVTKHAYQGLYFDDITAPGYYDGFRFYNNLILTDMYHGINWSIAKNCYAWRNTAVKDVDNYEATESGTTGPWLKDSAGSDNNTFQQNFASSIGAGGTNRHDANNIVSASAEAVYLANFAGDGSNWRPTSKATILAAFAPKAGGQLEGLKIGAIGSYIDFDALTVDTTDAPWNADTVADSFSFTDVTGAIASAQQTTSAVTVAGIDASIPTPVWCSAGCEFQINSTGSWLTSGTVVLGDTVRLRANASASSGLTISYTVSIGGTSDTWSITTAAANRVIYDGTNDNLSRTSALANVANGNAFSFAARLQLNGGDGAAQILLDTGTTATSANIRFRLSRVATTNFVRLEAFNAAGTAIFNALSTATFTTATGDAYLFISWNPVDGAFTMYLNSASIAPVTATTNVVGSTTVWNATYWSLFGTRAGTGRVNATETYLWADDVYVDWSDSAKRTAAQIDNIGVNGENITGSTPVIFINANAAEQNGGTGNKGSGGAFTMLGAVVDA